MKLATLGPFVAHPKPEDEGEGDLVLQDLAEEASQVPPIAEREKGSSLASDHSTQDDTEKAFVRLADYLHKKRQSQGAKVLRLRAQKIKKYKDLDDFERADWARQMGFHKKI